MQLAFGDAEDLGGRKRTRREVFLGEMDQVVPWKALLALIEPHYPKMGRPGRQPYALVTMLRVHFLQQWYALSDPAMEEALVDTPVMRRFAQLGGLDDIPDETTILNFRRLLETHGLAEKIFRQVNAHLQRKGLSLRSGTIVDATIISRTSIPGDQATVRLREGALSRYWEERRTGADAIRVVELVDVTPVVDAGGGISASAGRGKPVWRRGEMWNSNRIDAIAAFKPPNHEGSVDCSDLP